MAMPHETRSLPELIGGLANDISTLFRKEIELAKAETTEKVSGLVGGLVFLIAGAVLALSALGVLLAAVVAGLGALFANMGMDPILANSLAALIVGAIVAIIAWVLISRGLKAFSASNIKLERTASSLNRDAAVVKERL